MNTPNDDERLEQSAKAAFDDSVDRLDAATLSKLNQGRQAALAEIAASPGRQWLRWMPVTGMATAALVAVLVIRGPEQSIEPFESGPIATDFEILIGDDELEMIEELEFYSWIDMADLDSVDNVG